MYKLRQGIISMRSLPKAISRKWVAPGCGCAIGGSLKLHPSRSLSKKPAKHGVPLPASNVYLSTCQDVYYNLAFEDWLYRNVELNEDTHLLVLWRNNPCVVIGRHQNPWAECDVKRCRDSEVDVARRNSGGGTVYHDRGNINCTFFMHRKKYERKTNLDIIARALVNRWSMNVRISDRDDLLLEDQFKISGTAAKLGGDVAYHHCTLIFDVDKDQLAHMLTSPMIGVQSRATESVPSQVKNLCEANSSVTYAGLVAAISEEFMAEWGYQGSPEYVDPTSDRQFAGILDLYRGLKSWEWIYAKTPKFSIARHFQGRPQGVDLELDLEMDIEKGLLQKVTHKVIVGPCECREGLLQEISMFLDRICELQESTAFTKPAFDEAMHKANSLELLQEDSGVKTWVLECAWDIVQV